MFVSYMKILWLVNAIFVLSLERHIFRLQLSHVEQC
ncbi:unnamed protein product [Arabidopsis halleri]